MDFSDLNLSRFQTLAQVGRNEPPTLAMVRCTRLYGLGPEDVPKGRIDAAAMRDLYQLLVRTPTAAFISEKEVFVTRKEVVCPRDMKKVAVEELLLSIEVPVVRQGVLEFLLNEVLPYVCPRTTDAWSLEFLLDFDRLLSLPVKNRAGEYAENYNFRNLKHRICASKLSPDQLGMIRQRAPRYVELIKVFQEE